MFNDVGVIAATRTSRTARPEPGFRVYIAGGLGANPHPALALEEFTSREDLLPTIEAVLRVFDQTGNRDNKLRARMKWVVDQLGIDEVRRRVLKVRHTLPASSSWPGGIPEIVPKAGDAPAGVSTHRRADRGRPGRDRCADAARSVSAVGGHQRHPWQGQRGGVGGRLRRARRHHRRPVPLAGVDPARARRRRAPEQPPERRVPRPHRGAAAGAVRPPGGHRHGSPGAELARDVVACPGADTCNIAVTQSRGLAKAIGEQLEEEGLAEVGGVRINISGCTNSCGQHHTADIGFFGAERRAHGKSAPGYQMLLGGYVGQEQIHFGDKALRLPAKAAPEAAVPPRRRGRGQAEAARELRRRRRDPRDRRRVRELLGHRRRGEARQAEAQGEGQRSSAAQRRSSSTSARSRSAPERSCAAAPGCRPASEI